MVVGRCMHCDKKGRAGFWPVAALSVTTTIMGQLWKSGSRTAGYDFLLLEAC